MVNAKLQIKKGSDPEMYSVLAGFERTGKDVRKNGKMSGMVEYDELDGGKFLAIMK